MQMSTKLAEYLRTDEGVLRQLQWNFYILRLYLPIERNFERQNNLRYKNSIESNQKCFKFPKFPTILMAYDLFTTSVFIWISLKYLWPSLMSPYLKFVYYLTFNGYDSLEVKNDSHCFVFGGFVFHFEVSNEVCALLVAMYHLIWRLAQATLGRPLWLDLLLFLMQPRDEVERFISKLEAVEVCKQDVHSPTYRTTLTNTTPLNYDHLSPQERLLCDIMCYKVERVDKPDLNHHRQARFKQPLRVTYKLRPNRTLAARERLVDSLAGITTTASVALILMIVCCTIYILSVILFNQYRYSMDYSGCDPEFSRLFEQGQISHWSVPRLTSHRLAVIIADIFENYFIWTETGVIFLYGLLFINYLNEDLLFYWNHLDEEIRQFLLDTRSVHQIFNDNQNLTNKKVFLLPTSYEQKVHELQVQWSDFFRQIQQVDLMISDAITHALIIWLSGFGLISYSSAELWTTARDREMAIVYILITAIAFGFYSIVSIALLQLQRRCHLGYRHLCSIMALDHSRYKLNFRDLMRYYTDKNRACYTWFQAVPFSRSNFLSMVGSSFTGFLILDSVYHRRG